MILRNEKRKRKQKLEESEEDNDKYVAFRRKTRKSTSQSKKEKQASCTISSSSIEKALVKKGKKKKKLEIGNEDTEESKTVITPKVTISAKPKINKAAVELNAAIKAQTVKKLLTNRKKNKSNQNMSKNHWKEETCLDDDSEIELIEPEITLEPPIEDIQPSTSKILDIDSPTLMDDSSTEFAPIVIQANLKKSTNSYIPKILRDDEVIIVDKPVANNSTETEKKTKKKSDSDISVDKSALESNNIVKTLDDSNADIPKALQDFYSEVTRGFEALAEKSTKTGKKSKKKKSALSMDKSVGDSNNLVDIVQKNTVLLDNSNLADPANVAQFFSLENKVILVLWPDTQFSFLGKLKLRVLYGAVELYGCTLDPQNTIKPVEIYSPRGYSSISISTYTLDDVYDKEALWDVLTSEGVDRSLKTKLHDIIKECKSGWSILLLENFENTLTNFLNSHCTFKLFPKVENVKYSWCDPKRAEFVLQANFQFYNSGNEISICPQWNESVTKQLLERWNSKKSLCTMIVGGKGVGKSTTARYLINNLLMHSKKIVLLDLDPGQAEFTPAACVSVNIVKVPLLGPNYTHLKIPIYQLYLEDINVSNCITRYIECVEKLVECLKTTKDLAQYPIIINTMGFCKGIGLDICTYLIKLIEPSNVIQIISKRPRNNFDFALLKETINARKTSATFWNDENTVFEKNCDYELHYVPSVAEGKRQFDTWNMEPRQQRELVLLSYLSDIIKNADDKCFCNFISNSINNVIPYSLPFSSFYVSLIKSSISPTHILAAMNGNIVALCGIDLDNETPAVDKEALNYPMVVIKPPPCTCYGYGIVRGIDMKRRCVYVNTPLSKSQLRHVNLLAGCSAVPFSMLHSGERTSGPYAGDRGELPTSRDARRGYFRVDQTKNP